MSALFWIDDVEPNLAHLDCIPKNYVIISVVVCRARLG